MSKKVNRINQPTHLSKTVERRNERKMSGVSLAMGPRTEPDKTITSSTTPQQKLLHHQRQQQPLVGGVMGSLRVIELQQVAFIMVFSISGLVPLLDLLFRPSSPLTFSLSHVWPFRHTAELLFLRRKYSKESGFSYVIIGTTVGLFLPLAYVLDTNGEYNKMSDQLDLGGLSLFSPPVRALLPLLYTIRILFVIVDWISEVWMNKTLPANAQMKDVTWHRFGKSLAVANILVNFSINLFGFLIPPNGLREVF